MDVILLMPVFQEIVNWNKSRINFLANFIIALLKVRTVNFTEIATAFNGKTKDESKYKRIVRFFRLFPIDFVVIAKLIVSLLPIKDQSWAISIDRTNWKLGQVNINILMLGISYKGIAFPLLWTLLPKRGNSNTLERKQLMKKFISIFSVDKIQCLIADREFIGKKWFSFLKNNNILFRIRIKENMLVSNSMGIEVPVKNLFRHLQIGESLILPKIRRVCGNKLYVVGIRLLDEYVIVVTNSLPETALRDYGFRWQIETLFGCLKTRGFHFEDTHLTDPERIKKLISLLSIAFVWAHIVGEWLNEQKPIKIKKHGRKAKSFFRYGFDYLRSILFNFTDKMALFQQAISLLLLPPNLNAKTL